MGGPLKRKPGFTADRKSARGSKNASARLDGELYARPEPNPFTPEWTQGYDDGLEDRPYRAPIEGNPQNYRDGYDCGQVDAQELDRTGSSNA